MNGLFVFLAEATKGIRLYASSSRQRATVKALRIAIKIKRLDILIDKIDIKKKLTIKDIRRKKAYKKKKVKYWEYFDEYIAIN